MPASSPPRRTAPSAPITPSAAADPDRSAPSPRPDTAPHIPTTARSPVGASGLGSSRAVGLAGDPTGLGLLRDGGQRLIARPQRGVT